MPRASTRRFGASNPYEANLGISIFLLLQVGFTDCNVAVTARELLPHAFTLTTHSPKAGGRSTFCGTGPGVAPGRRYRPPCPMEPGLSSRVHAHRRPSDPLVLSAAEHTRIWWYRLLVDGVDLLTKAIRTMLAWVDHTGQRWTKLDGAGEDDAEHNVCR